MLQSARKHSNKWKKWPSLCGVMSIKRRKVGVTKLDQKVSEGKEPTSRLSLVSNE